MKAIKAEIYIEGMDELEELLKEAGENARRLERTISKIEAERLRVNLKMQETTVKSDLERERKVTPGLEIIKRLDISAGELADMLCGSCPPYICNDTTVDCDATSCRDCWLAWLATGRPPRKEGGKNEINKNSQMYR